jgi:MATE family multidrug resistance protein
MAVASCLMGYFGVDALAALQITSQYSIIVIMPGIGIAQALSLKVSELYGQPGFNHYPIKKYLFASMLLLTSYILPVSFLYCTLSTKFAEFYMGKSSLRPDFEHLIHVFFVLAAIFLLLDGIRNLLSGVLRGLHHSKTATMINLASLWLISIPISGLNVFVFNGNPVALRIGFLSGFIVAVLSLAWYLYKHMTTVNSWTYPVNWVRTITPRPGFHKQG